MAGKNRVAWREGMFLRPQHFQAQDRFIDSQLRARVDSMRPHPWGFTDLVIDEDLASLGKFGVIRAAGVMPDGTPFSIPDELPPPAPLDVPGDARDAIVSLTLPAQQVGAVEFRDADTPAAEARFLVDEGEVADAFSDDRTTEPIEFGRPNLRFGVTRDQTYGRVTIGVARIREVQNGRLMFDDRYIPSTLDMNAALRLRNGLTDIVGRAQQRAEELALRAVEATDGGAETFASFLLLQALNRLVPLLEHLEGLPMVHPERLYELLLTLAGEIATFASPDRRAQDYAVYDHDDLHNTFEPLLRDIQAFLSVSFGRRALRLEIIERAQNAFVSAIRDRALFRTANLILEVAARRPLTEIQSQFPYLFKIGPNTKMNEIVHANLPGVGLVHLPTPPPQIRALADHVYFLLDRNSPLWSDFSTAQAIAMHFSGDWPELELELWAVLGDRR